MPVHLPLPLPLSPKVPEIELLPPGHAACAGCGASLAVRQALKVLGEKTIVVIPACCWVVIAGEYPYTALAVPTITGPFACAPAMATGIARALRRAGDAETVVLVLAGDGSTFDIGLATLSGALERGEDLLYLCYDNEGYMNTGIQRSSSTPQGAWTTTTPLPSPESTPKKDIMEIICAHRPLYAATATFAHWEDFRHKLEVAKKLRGGMRFLHLLSVCPPGWQAPENLTVKLARLAVDTKVFNLYEVYGGETWRLTVQPRGLPITEYTKHQGRFRHLSAEELEYFQRYVDQEWNRLLQKVSRASSLDRSPVDG